MSNAQPRPLMQIRLEQGLSRRALAQRAGCSPATIYGIESDRRVPIPQTARKLSDALGVELVGVAEFEAAISDWVGPQRIGEAAQRASA